MDLQVSTSFRRHTAAVPWARAYVDRALVSAGVPRQVVDRLVLAVAEACNNAILHADGDTFTVSVAVVDSTCTLTVSDLGRGFDPPPRARMPAPETVGQRGLALMEALVDRLEVTSSPTGTTVVLAQDVTPDSEAERRGRQHVRNSTGSAP